MNYFAQKNIFILFLLFCSNIIGHGFESQTLVQLPEKSPETIHALCLRALHDKVFVVSYDVNNSQAGNKLVTKGKQSTTNCFIRLGFDSEPNNDIVCTPTQEFYIPILNTWMPAYKLKPGDTLLTQNMTAKAIKYKEFIPQPLKIYMLEIQESHTFFVGKYGVLTHNMALPVAAYLGFTVPFWCSCGWNSR